MAMNKRERAALDAAEEEAAMARALRWSRRSPESIPPDIQPPGPGDEATSGWSIIPYCTIDLADRAQRCWSTASSHGRGVAPDRDRGVAPDRDRASQRGMALYSTRLMALQALRVEHERQAAKLLLEVDLEIEEEERRTGEGCMVRAPCDALL